jgi:hypothetical protein
MSEKNTGAYQSESRTTTKQTDSLKLILIIIAGIILLAGAVFAAYRFSQGRAGDIVLPGGTTYLGPSPTTGPVQATSVQQPTSIPKFTADASVPWRMQTGRIYPFSFSYPSTLSFVVFSNDPSDSFGIVWGNTPPQQNLLIYMEIFDPRNPALSSQPKIDYVKNWYKAWSGLKGVKSVEPFTNAQGLKGYKAQFINTAGATPNWDIFFEVPGKTNMMLHLANGILDQSVFDKIVDSIQWGATTPIPSKPAVSTTP